MKNLTFNPSATSFFLHSGKPGMQLKTKKRKYNIAKLRPSEIDSHIENLPLGNFQYVMTAEHRTTVDGLKAVDYYFKIGCSNHAIIALSQQQIKQITDQETFNQAMDSVIVLAAGDLNKTPTNCHLTDQSGGFHQPNFSREIHIDHQNLLQTMQLSHYPFYYYTTLQQCEKTISMLTHSQLSQIVAQKNRIAIFKTYDRLLRSQSTQLGISVPESVNNELILDLAQKRLADTHTIRPQSAPLLPSQIQISSCTSLLQQRPQSSPPRRSLSLPTSLEERKIALTTHKKPCRRSTTRLFSLPKRKKTRVVPTNKDGSLFCDLRLSPREDSRYSIQSCDDASVICLKYGTNNICT